VLLGIKDIVEDAAKVAGSDAQVFAVPFPGNGQQARFREAMTRIISKLPRNTAAGTGERPQACR